MNQLICPLLSLGREHLVHCLADDCAWYCSETEQCGIVQISDELSLIGDMLEED